MVESGVPVDVVGGTSQGAFVGALIAMIHDPKQPNKTRQELIRLCRIFALEMSSNWAKIKDLTFPITSYFNGGVFNSGIMRHFGDLRIEDLWLDYFCISTDITASKGIVHHNGMLWRYVRASMTLGPYLPPMCEVYPGDDDDVRRRHSHLNRRHFTHIVGTCWYLLVLVGTCWYLISVNHFSQFFLTTPQFFPSSFFLFFQVHYLVDGGYVNNLPADEMKRLQGPLAIVAVDVANYSSFGNYHDYGDRLSGCWQLWRNFIKPLFCRLLCCGLCEKMCCNVNHKRCNNIQTQKPVPSMTDISDQLAYVCETRQLPDRLRNDIDLYLKPSVTQYGTLEFGKFGEIRDIGYKHTRISLLAWRDFLSNGGGGGGGRHGGNDTTLLRECFRGGEHVFDDLVVGEEDDLEADGRIVENEEEE